MTGRRQILSAAIMTMAGLVSPVSRSATAWDAYCDIAIVGGGGAGLAAAARAGALGLQVSVFEKMPTVGGNTRLASGYISAPWPRFQKALGIADSWQKFAADIKDNAGPTGNSSRIERLAQESTRTLDWLEAMGLRYLSRFRRAFSPRV